MENQDLQDAIAVIALAGRFPGAGDVETFWDNLCGGVESISFFAPDEMAAAGVDAALARNPAYVGAKGVVDGVERFDAAFFGLTPREAERTDPQHRLLLECAWEALEAAGYGREEQEGPVGVFVGAGESGYFGSAPPDLETAFGGRPDFLATRISYKLNLRGPSLAVQTACSTSLVAVHLACKSLLDGECDMALAGGVSVRLPQRAGHLFQEEGIYSPDGHCRAFDAAAGGTVGGNGAGLVLLKRLDDALAARDPIRAVIRGSAINNDGSGKIGFTAPSIDGQAQVIAEALALARVDPATLGYVEAHGTGTPLGDPIEVAGLTQAFAAAGCAGTAFCALGSVKTNIGHLDAAAGVAGLIKAVLAVERGVLPPSLHFTSPNPRIGFADSPFYVNARLAPWPAERSPRRAGVSSFGMGGTNAHVVLEEPPAPAPPDGSPGGRPFQLLLLSARTETALEAATARLAAHLRRHPDLDISDVAFTLHTGRRRFEHRRMTVCAGLEDAVAALESGSPARLPTGRRRTEDPPVVFLFPGQGAQHAGMARGLYETEAVFREQVDLGREILLRRAGLDLAPVLFPEPEGLAAAENTLEQTAWAQPALFVVEHALARLWMAWGIQPEALIGHSLGEYVAACLAGVFPLEEALALVAERGALVQALPRGAMLAVPLPEAEVVPLLGPDLALAAVNAPDRCVVSGPEEGIAALAEELGGQGVPCRRLHTSHAFHSAAVDPILAAFAERVRAARPRPPEIPFLSNVTGDWITAEEATDPEYWARHLRQTVRFADGVRRLGEEPERVYLEVGPGRTLGALVRQTLGLKPGDGRVMASLRHSREEGREEGTDSASLLAAAGGLWLAGARLDGAALHGAGRRVTLPTYPFERKPFWIGTPEPVSTLSQSFDKEEPMAEPHHPGNPDPHHNGHVRQLVQELFAELFGTSPADVPSAASFLELGADSLFLLRASQVIQQRLGVKVPFRRLLEDLATVDSLADHLALELGPAWEPREPVAPPAPASAPPAPAELSAAPLPALLPALAPEPPRVELTAAEPPASSGLQRIVAEQLRLMQLQLEALTRNSGEGYARGFALRPAEPAPALPVSSPPPPTSPLPISPPSPVSSASPLSSLPSPRRSTFVPYQPLDRGPGGELTPRQRAHLDGLIERLCRRTRGSKELAQSTRPVLANNRASAGFRRLWKELVYPLVGHRGAGSRIWDVDGNEYVDLTMGYGSLLFGHSPEFLRRALAEQVELGIQIGPESETAGRVAELICELTGHERATFTNSGTEAVMTALRLARTVTGRPGVAVFTGSFHGTFDGLLAKGDRGGAGGGDGWLRTVPLAPGVPQHLIERVLMLDFDDPDCLAAIEAHAGELAAVLVEPRQSRRPDLDPGEMLHRLRELTRRTGIALIFDEVITGFRMHLGGMQALYGLQADITTYGKAVGNGMPVGVIAGRAAFLDAVDGGFWRYGDDSIPEADTTFIAGTFFRHPLVMAGVLAVLTELKEKSPRLQEELGRRTGRLADSLNTFFEREELPVRIVHFGSLFSFTFPPEWTFAELFYYHLLEKGIYIWERRVCYLSTAHAEADLERFEAAVRESVRDLRQGGFLPERVKAPPSPPAPSPGPPREVPLTEAQRELWALAQLGDDASVAYNLSTSLRLRGPLREHALRRSLQAVVDRHDALRLVIDPLGEVQRAVPHLRVDLPVDDLSGAVEPERELAARLEAEARGPFDLARGPLLRARLFRVEADLHVLALTVHHITADGRSLGLLLDEISWLYTADLTGEAAVLPVPASFAEHAARLAEASRGAELEGLGAFWRQRFAGPVPALELPTDRPRPPFPTYTGDRRVLSLEGEAAAEVRRLARGLGSTPFVLLLAAIGALLHRLTGQDDLVVGVPASSHPLDGGPLVGYCIDVLPLRLALPGDPPFAEVVRGARRVLLDAQEHQGYPFSRLLRDLGFSRDPGRPPLVSVLFNLDRLSGPGLSLPGLEVEVAGTPTRGAQFDLEWNVIESDGGFTVECFYNTDLFDGGTVERWQECLRQLLAAAAASPEQRVGDLDLLPEESRRRLAEQNRTHRGFPLDRCFPELFAERARNAPDAVAAACDGGELTYAELDRRVTALARILVLRGVGPESPVALLAPRGLDFLTAVLGTFLAGGAYLPLDPRQPAQRHRQVLEQSGARHLVVAAGLLEDAREAAAGLEVLPLEEALAAESPAVSLPPLDPDQLAYVIYTSGSTGAPKGAMLTHRGMLNHLFAKIADLGLDAGGGRDTVAQTASQAFDISIWQLLAPLLLGGRVRIYGDDLVYTPLDLLGRVDADGVTILETVPSLLAALLAELERRGGSAPGLAALRWLLVTGEALPPELCARWLARYPGVPLLNAYGPTECSDDVAHQPVRRPPPAGAPRVPVGRPVANTRLYVVDPLLRPVPPGGYGELCVGGIGVGRGYLREPGRTAAVFVPDPFSPAPSGRLYRTGDRARLLEEGEVDFLGRLDQQVKIRGFRVEPGEIEAALGRHPGVRQAVAVVREDGPGERRLVAYVVPTGRPGPSTAELRDHLGARLPAAMVPAAFVVLDELPLTPNGKVDRRALPPPEPAAAGGRIARSGGGGDSPLTPAEELLAGIWRRLLKVETVGAHDDFFELGGDSILGIQVLARAREAGLRLSPRQIFEHPTIAGLAAVAEALPAVREDRGPVSGPVPLTPIQRWFFEHAFADPHHWNLSMLHEVRPPVDLAALATAVGACLEHHDALRLRLSRDGRGWSQRNAPPGDPLPLTCVDVSALPALPSPARRGAIEAACAQAQGSLDFEHGPLPRFVFFDLGAGVPGRLLVTVHHLAMDIVSWQILHEDLEAAYQQARAGRAVELPARTTSFQEWARRLEEHARSPRLRAELPYWLDQDWAEAPRLPLDGPAGGNREATVRRVVERLGPEETRALLYDVPRSYRTQVSDVLLTALAQAFAAWTGQPRLLVELEGHGREPLFEDVDLSRTVGWFTSIYPVLLEVGDGGEGGGEADLGTALKRVKQRLRAVPNGGIGYGLLRYLGTDPTALEIAAALRSLPQAEVVFNYGGRGDGSQKGGGWLTPLPEGTERAEDKGPSRSPRGHRSHLLQIDGWISGGCLEVYWHYSEAVFRPATVEALARGFSEALRRIVAYCASPASSATPGYISADFPGARVNQADLDRFLSRLGRTAEEKRV